MVESYSDSAAQQFNAGWLFAGPDVSASCTASEVSGDVLLVTLPHSWNSEGWTYDPKETEQPSGTGWYYNLLDSNVREGSVLKFDGVSAECEIYLNGQLLHRNLGAYRIFEVELTSLRRTQPNLLAVKVVDKTAVGLLPEGSDEVFSKSPRFVSWSIPYGSSTKAGGIWRDVWLLDRAATYMRTPSVQSYGGRLTIQPDIVGRKEGWRVRHVLRYSGREVASGETLATESLLSLNVETHREWRPLHPELYVLTSTLLNSSGAEVQTIRQPVAFFDFTVRDSEFYINGKPYFLRGQNGIPHCNEAYDTEYIAKYISRIREQGVEITRSHTEPPTHAWLDECDRQGIMVIFEMALHGSIGCYPFGSEEFQKNAIEEFRSLVLEYRRHPSIVMWCLGNELIVSCERDINLGGPLFDTLERWIKKLRPLDPRPIIANSGSDAVNLIAKTVGDVDDIHQYGGWYVENIRDLRNFGRYTSKNDMVFQPCISTESIAAYTNGAGEFFIDDAGDVRQNKVVRMRLGKITDLSEQAQGYQSFLLKEYAEAMWRLRHAGSSFSGYIPFGQYTWFSRPFDKTERGIQPKRIWETYRQVLGPVHIQFECWNRHLCQDGTLVGMLHLFHESVALPDHAHFTVQIINGSEVLYEHSVAVDYHSRYDTEIKLKPRSACGQQTLTLRVIHKGGAVAENKFQFRVYPAVAKIENRRAVYVYDPLGRVKPVLKQTAYGRVETIEHIESILSRAPRESTLLIGPHALDKTTQIHSVRLNEWIAKGGRTIVLEQNPGIYSEDVLNSGIGFIKANQPYWSRWASNLVKHSDRADIVHEDHPIFLNLTEDDMSWWNGDTFLAHAYLGVKTESALDIVLSRIGNGLAEGELMPVVYDYIEPGYSFTMIERHIGSGTILLTSLLVGEKSSTEPVAQHMLRNLLLHYADVDASPQRESAVKDQIKEWHITQ